MRKPILVAAALLLVGASPAFAQRCVGAGSLNHAPVQFGAGVAFAGSTERDLGAAVVAGHDAFFVHGNLSYAELPALNIGGTSFGGGIGGQMALDPHVALCVITRLQYTPAIDVAALHSSEFDTVSLAQMGITVVETKGVAIVPTVGGGIEFARATLDAGRLGSVVVTDHFGIARFGVGVIVNDQFAITPALTVPFASGGQTTFSLGMTYNFGR
jgi:hypothetical protein